MESSNAGTSGVKIIKRMSLFERIKTCEAGDINRKLEETEMFLINSENYTEDELKTFKHVFSHFKTECKKRWIAAHRKIDRFLSINEKWLEGSIELPKPVSRPGRPQKPFSEVSERSKRRKTEELRQNTEIDELIFAAQVKLQTSGMRTASTFLKNITDSPTRAQKYKKAIHSSSQENIKQMSPDKALAFFVEAGLTRTQYEVIRKTKKALYPCYSLLQKAKQMCYPKKEGFIVTATHAEVLLQHLMDHTSQRLCKYLEDVINNFAENNNLSMSLICKWGCDGSQQSQFKQKLESESDSDLNIFQSSFVPLQLINKITNTVIWQNPLTSSPRFCRPIRIRFIKETADLTNEEVDYMERQIKNLQNTCMVIGEKFISVDYNFIMSMIDAKVCNAVTHTSSTMRCYICGATSKHFNKIEEQRKVITENLKFGLSTLHARIRLFESLLHVAYNLSIKKWQIRCQDEKDMIKIRKEEIQKEFRNRMGLLVDIPKAGLGNTNDGNTSRRFFSDVDLAADITGLDRNLLFRFKVISEAISSGYTIDKEKFSAYALDTAKLYIQLYPWYPMSPTMHKILIHGALVIEKASLPIGLLSEEAAEARNKHFRLYRLNYSRKFSRIACNQDVINRLLLTSDPYISCTRPIAKKKSKSFEMETMELFRSPEILPEDSSSEEDELDDDEDPWTSS